MDKTTTKKDSILLMELRKLGLTQKEAALYLFIMDENEATATELALMSRMSRPTAYRILDGLEKKNLVNKIKKNRKTLFVATSPNTLLGLLKIKKKEAEEQEREFMRIISMLQTTYALKNSGNITELEISRGLDIFLDDLSNTPTEEILAFYGNLNVPTRRILHNTYKNINDRFKNLEVKELCYQKKACTLTDSNFIKTKQLRGSSTDYSIIAADKIFIITKDSISIINHTETVVIIKSLLKILWSNL